jgi:hypothetical protein
MLSSASRNRGSLTIDPCDTKGLAPITIARSVRQRSGIGRLNGVPYSNWLATVREAPSSVLMP